MKRSTRGAMLATIATAVTAAGTAGVASAQTAQQTTARAAVTWKITEEGTYRGEDWLSGVVATSRKSAWAGGSIITNGYGKPVVRRWNGKKWRNVKAPTVGKGFFGTIDASSDKNVWLFGHVYGEDPGGASVLKAMRWNGNRWKTTKVDTDPSHSDSEVVSKNNVWVAGQFATGTATLKHWNGRKWGKVSLPAHLYGLNLTSASNGWAVGVANGQPVTYKKTRGGWKKVKAPRYTVPNNGDAFLNDVIVLGKKKAIAVGSMNWLEDENGRSAPKRSVPKRSVPKNMRDAYRPPLRDDPDEINRPIAMLWNGRKWSKIKTDDRNTSLNGITKDGKGGIWTKDGLGNILNYTKSGKWKIVPLPRVPDSDGGLDTFTNVPGTTKMLGVGTVSRWAAPEDDKYNWLHYAAR